MTEIRAGEDGVSVLQRELGSIMLVECHLLADLAQSGLAVLTAGQRPEPAPSRPFALDHKENCPMRSRWDSSDRRATPKALTWSATLRKRPLQTTIGLTTYKSIQDRAYSAGPGGR